MQPNLDHLYELPSRYLAIGFILLTCFGVAAFYYILKAAAYRSAPRITTGVIIWLAVIAWPAYDQFFLTSSPIPPPFLLVVLPPVGVLAALFLFNPGQVTDRLSPRLLTNLNLLRVPVELFLFGLFMEQQLPELMTYEGRNPDILSGLTAPLIGYLGFRGGRVRWPLILIWHVMALALLINIVATAILSAPFPFQRFGFEQPNVAVLKFPFIWLPGFIVPLVLLTHLVVIKQAVRGLSAGQGSAQKSPNID